MLVLCYPDLPHLTARQHALAVDAGLAFSTVQRIVHATVGPSLDNIERIADALGLAPYQLLLPNLNPTKPQAVRGANQAEIHFYRAASDGRELQSWAGKVQQGLRLA